MSKILSSVLLSPASYHMFRQPRFQGPPFDEEDRKGAPQVNGPWVRGCCFSINVFLLFSEITRVTTDKVSLNTTQILTVSLPSKSTHILHVHMRYVNVHVHSQIRTHIRKRIHTLIRTHAHIYIYIELQYSVYEYMSI